MSIISGGRALPEIRRYGTRRRDALQRQYAGYPRFDKTGTLTEGKPQSGGGKTFNGVNEAQALRHSGHIVSHPRWPMRFWKNRRR